MTWEQLKKNKKRRLEKKMRLIRKRRKQAALAKASE